MTTTDAEQIVEVLATFHWWNYGLNEVDQVLRDRPVDDQDWIRDLAEEIVAKALPTPTEVRVEYAAWCHAEDPGGIRLDQDRFASRAQAVAWGDEQIGRYGITGYRVMRREHHIFPEGSRYATAITAWVEDAEGEQR